MQVGSKPRCYIIHNASYASESYLIENCYMMIGSDTHSYQEAFHDPRWQSTMQDKFNSLQENETFFKSKINHKIYMIGGGKDVKSQL